MCIYNWPEKYIAAAVAAASAYRHGNAVAAAAVHKNERALAAMGAPRLRMYADGVVVVHGWAAENEPRVSQCNTIIHTVVLSVVVVVMGGSTDAPEPLSPDVVVRQWRNEGKEGRKRRHRYVYVYSTYT